MRRILEITFAAMFLSSAAQAQTCAASGLQIQVTPSVADIGQPITVSLTNTTTSCAYSLPSSCLFGSVHPATCSNPPVTAYGCAAVIIPIPPGQTLAATWDQKDMTGSQVAAGTYAFDIKVWTPGYSNLMSFCPTFTICSRPPIHYGSGDAGTAGFVPTMGLQGGAPTIGNTNFQLAVRQGLGGAPALLAFSAAPAAIHASWGTVLIDPVLRLLYTPLTLGGNSGVGGEGKLAINLPIPNFPSLVGTPIFAQTFIFDPGSSGSISHTEGLHLTFCPR